MDEFPSVFYLRPTPGQARSKRTAAGATTVRIQSGVALTRNRPPAPGDGLRNVLVGAGELAQEAPRAFERHRPERGEANAARPRPRCARLRRQREAA